MSQTVPVMLKVNGLEHDLDVEPRLLLVHALRDRLDLTGTHVGPWDYSGRCAST